MNSTLGRTVSLISSYRGCERLYNQIIICGVGEIILVHCWSNVFTKKVFPHDVGPEISAVKGCLKTKAADGGGGDGYASLHGGGGRYTSLHGGDGYASLHRGMSLLEKEYSFTDLLYKWKSIRN